MTQPAAIYARVSSDRQKEQHTIASQTAALLEYAQTHGYTVPSEWVFQDEGYSGALLVRPGPGGAPRSGGRGPDPGGARVCARPLEPQVRLPGAPGGGAPALRRGLGLSPGARQRHPRGSPPAPVSRHDCRVRTRANRRAVSAGQTAPGHPRRGERARGGALWVPVRAEDGHQCRRLRGARGRGRHRAPGVCPVHGGRAQYQCHCALAECRAGPDSHRHGPVGAVHGVGPPPQSGLCRARLLRQDHPVPAPAHHPTPAPARDLAEPEQRHPGAAAGGLDRRSPCPRW